MIGENISENWHEDNYSDYVVVWIFNGIIFRVFLKSINFTLENFNNDISIHKIIELSELSEFVTKILDLATN